VYDSYESDSELDMQDFQEQIAEPCPLFINENYYEEINYPGPAEITEQQFEEKRFPTGLFMMNMNLTLGRAKKKKRKNQRSNRRGILSSVQSRSMSSHRLRSVSLRQLLIRLCLPMIFSPV
jgi:hypothetical protein